MKSCHPASDAQGKSKLVASDLIVRRRIRSMRHCARNRIEQGKQQKSGKKTANMCLPCDACAVRTDRDRCRAKNDVDAEPDGEKGEHAAVPQGLPQRLRRYP